MPADSHNSTKQPCGDPLSSIEMLVLMRRFSQSDDVNQVAGQTWERKISGDAHSNAGSSDFWQGAGGRARLHGQPHGHVDKGMRIPVPLGNLQGIQWGCHTVQETE